MKRKILRTMGLSLLIGLGVVLVSGTAFVALSPQFGGKHTEEDQKRYADSGHYTDGKFQNLVETNMDQSFGNMFDIMKEFIKGNPQGRPQQPLPLEKVDSLEIVNFEEDRLVWFGHSAFLLKMDGKTILLDPMLGHTPAPHPMLGGKRYSKELPIDIEKIPEVDLILISHDHYDHLDYGSIQKLRTKTKKFLVPLGVGAHLKSWDVPEEAIQEFNWWDEVKLDELHLVFTPSRHFSGRGLTDRSTTLWGSWVIKGSQHSLYFSGDSGYGDHFNEIGEKFGPFDLALMECGQYNERWSNIHMMPEETAMAGQDVRAKVVMPIHWGAFTLALHDWNEPPRRMTEKAKSLGQEVLIPEIGQVMKLENLSVETSRWW